MDRRNRAVKPLYWQDEEGGFHPCKRKGEEMPIDALNKAPRWFLGIILGPLLLLCIFFSNRAVADMDKIKTVAWQAKSLSDDNQKDIGELKDTVNKIQAAQETFRKEYRDDQQHYREDQKDLDRKLSELLRAIKS